MLISTYVRQGFNKFMITRLDQRLNELNYRALSNDRVIAIDEERAPFLAAQF